MRKKGKTTVQFQEINKQTEKLKFVIYLNMFLKKMKLGPISAQTQNQNITYTVYIFCRRIEKRQNWIK